MEEIPDPVFSGNASASGRQMEGDIVEQGQLVMEADLSLIRARGYDPMVIVVRITPDA